MIKPFSIEDLIRVNRWSQGVTGDHDIVNFVDEKSHEDLHSLLVWSGELARQASASDKDAEAAIRQVPFKPTRSACVLLSKGVSAETYRRMESLKARDGQDAALLLLYLFKIADRRRCQTDEKCSHWWHRDLSDPGVIQEVKSAYEAGTL